MTRLTQGPTENESDTLKIKTLNPTLLHERLHLKQPQPPP